MMFGLYRACQSAIVTMSILCVLLLCELLLCQSGLAGQLAPPSSQSIYKRPNIVIILADDKSQ